jgi:hypothetical protein
MGMLCVCVCVWYMCGEGRDVLSPGGRWGDGDSVVPSRGLASAGGGGTRSMESGEGGPDENDSGGAGSGATVPSFLRFLYSAASESTASRSTRAKK